MDQDETLPDESESTQDSEPPQRIGPYRLVRKVGRGGMGEVYEAEQEEPVRRRVALKLIKWGMDTRSVVARFDAERQALALMDHPNIARVFDAGATPQGRPYFVMEFVKGTTIVNYCDRRNLTTSERLQLFCQVCEGVQHAHQNAIIHRDVKPSNVLVTDQDGKPIPKIIDFGVAKATDQRLTERTLFTELGQMIGTPTYMSPEQAEITPEGVDTRTDVYSLGVLLYELLVGALPFEPKELREAGFDEIRRKIREDIPSKPSSRLSTLGDSSAELAQRRRTQPAALVRLLRGDLDWITMKALEKDRNRRYSSPRELAADIERHLKNQPVLASPPSITYRMWKFARRHRVAVLAAGLLLASLMVGMAGTTFGLIRATRAEGAAQREAATASEVSRFLVGLFEESEPARARGADVTARELLESGTARIAELDAQPLVQAQLMHVIGKVHQTLGLYGEGLRLVEGAVEIRRRLLGRDHLDTLDSLNQLLPLYQELRRHDEMLDVSRQVLEGRRKTLGEDHVQTMRAKSNLAVTYRSLGRYDEAERLFVEVRDQRIRVLGKEHPDSLFAVNAVGMIYLSQGRVDEAEPIFVETLRVRRQMLGDDHPDTLWVLYRLGRVYHAQGRYDEAERVLLESLEGRIRVLGEDHPRVANTLWVLGEVHYAQGDRARSEDAYRKSLEIKRVKMGEDSPDYVYAIARHHALLGDRDEAIEYLRQAVALGVAGERVVGHPELSSLQGDPEFEAIVAEIESRIEAE